MRALRPWCSKPERLSNALSPLVVGESQRPAQRDVIGHGKLAQRRLRAKFSYKFDLIDVNMRLRIGRPSPSEEPHTYDDRIPLQHTQPLVCDGRLTSQHAKLQAHKLTSCGQATHLLSSPSPRLHPIAPATWRPGAWCPAPETLIREDPRTPEVGKPLSGTQHSHTKPHLPFSAQQLGVQRQTP